MTEEELAEVIPALEIMIARTGHRRFRELIVDNALGCEHHRRLYAALMLRMVDSPQPREPRLELTAEDRARTRADEFECTCHLGGCRGGACGVAS